MSAAFQFVSSRVWARLIVGLLSWVLADSSVAEYAPSTPQCGETPSHSMVQSPEMHEVRKADYACLPMPDTVLPADALPEIGLRLLEGSVEPSEWRLFVNGEDVTAHSQVTDAGVKYGPKQPLSEGLHRVAVRHQQWSYAWSFETATAPEILLPEPVGVTAAGELRPRISMYLFDVGAGVDFDSLLLKLNGIDVTDLVNSIGNRVEFVPEVDLTEGWHTVDVSVSDLAGNSVGTTWTFMVGSGLVIQIDGGESVSWLRGSDFVLNAMISSQGRLNADSFKLLMSRDEEEFEDLIGLAIVELLGESEARLSYTHPELAEVGLYNFIVSAETTGGVSESAEQYVLIEEDRSYVLEVISPADGVTTTEKKVEVTVAAYASGDVPGGDTQAPFILTIADRELAGFPHRVDGRDTYRTLVSLEPGSNLVRIQAHFQGVGGRVVVRDALLEVDWIPGERERAN